MSYLYERKNRLRRAIQIALAKQFAKAGNSSNTKGAYYAYSNNIQYIPAEGRTYTVNWEDSETNKNIKVNVTVIKNETAFHKFISQAQASNWSKFAATFMPDETSIQYWDPYNDNRSEFVTNCPVTPYNFLFFYSLYEQDVKIILESKRRVRMLFSDYVKYHNIYKNYNNRIDMEQEMYEIVQEQIAYITENYFTDGLNKCYKTKLARLCSKNNISLNECEKRIPKHYKKALYEKCLNAWINEKWNLLQKKYFNEIYTKTIETIWERFSHLLNEERFTNIINHRIGIDYEDSYIIFRNNTLDWYTPPSIAASRDKQDGLKGLLEQIKYFYNSAMAEYHKKIKKTYNYYWPSLDEDDELEIPEPQGEFLEGFSYILVFEPNEEALPCSDSDSPFPWFIIPYAKRRQIDCRYYYPKIVDGETFLYLVPINYVIK